MKVAPLGWTLTQREWGRHGGHLSADQRQRVWERFLCVSTTPLWMDGHHLSGLFGQGAVGRGMCDINTFTLIQEHPAGPVLAAIPIRNGICHTASWFTSRLQAHHTATSSLLMFGYIKSVRPGDRYHAVLSTYPGLSSDDNGRRWDQTGTQGYSYVYNNLLSFDDANHRTIARPYHQLFGTTGWSLKGLFGRLKELIFPTGRTTLSI